MNEKIEQVFFALLRSSILGNYLNDFEKSLFSEDLLPDLYALSKNHDLSHLIAIGLEKNSLLAKDNIFYKKFRKQKILAVYRYEQMNYEYQRICDSLKNAKVSFIPLKGSVLREYYPEPWMRTSCDIDILIHESELDKAISYLIEQLGYVKINKGSHDVSMLTPGKIYIELHYKLLGESINKSSSDILKTIWDNVSVKSNNEYWYEMNDEMFYFYHIVHMAKHFDVGGCGVRPFIDLWILENIVKYENAKRYTLLQNGELLKFAKICTKLSKIWFAKASMDDLSMKMQDYLLRGGVYGNQENRVNVNQNKKGGKFGYAISRIFLPYNLIKYQYPILIKKNT